MNLQNVGVQKASLRNYLSKVERTIFDATCLSDAFDTSGETAKAMLNELCSKAGAGTSAAAISFAAILNCPLRQRSIHAH
jgi:hypothetical protein